MLTSSQCAAHEVALLPTVSVQVRPGAGVCVRHPDRYRDRHPTQVYGIRLSPQTIWVGSNAKPPQDGNVLRSLVLELAQLRGTIWLPGTCHTSVHKWQLDLAPAHARTAAASNASPPRNARIACRLACFVVFWNRAASPLRMSSASFRPAISAS